MSFKKIQLDFDKGQETTGCAEMLQYVCAGVKSEPGQHFPHQGRSGRAALTLDVAFRGPP